MKTLRWTGAVLLASLLLWSIVTWPLARHAFSGIAASATNPGNPPPQAMIAGDHLQLLYHFWLGHDTFFGKTPWSTNLYEFNTGDDAARRAYSTYYFPFHFFYGIGHTLSGPALGMNLAALLSLAVSLGASLLWLRRWLPGRPWLVWCAALIGQLLPYRWHNLMNGSPTGLALMWIPVILLGLDIWLRDRRASGAALAGAGVFFSGWSDTHAFFFSALFCAAWLLPALILTRRSFRPTRADLLGWLRSAWPLALWMLLVLVQVLQVKGLNSGTNVEGGRSLNEVALFSPHLADAFSKRGFGGRSETYLGPLLGAFLALGFVALILQARRGDRDAAWRVALLGVLLLGITAAALVATGPHNPFGAIWWTRLTRVLPPLSMIRQPAKIYLLLPPLLALASALTLSAFARRWDRVAAPALLLLLTWGLTSQLSPRVSLLDGPNQAYHAVATDAETPRALALPLWPGNSHWSSLYMHYAMQERLRMVNGYNPAPSLDYIASIFERFHPFNQGAFADPDLDALLARGVTHLLLHENAFPEKVSPFSVGATLSAMLVHPRLERLAQDGAVWAFRILPAGSQQGAEPAPPWQHFAAVRCWEIEDGSGDFHVVQDPTLFEGRAAVLETPGAELSAIDFPISLPDDRLLWLYAAGPGETEITLRWGEWSAVHRLTLSGSEPVWRALPLPAQPGFYSLHLDARQVSGKGLLDFVHLCPKDWNPALPEPRWIHASALFHAGYTDLTQNHVVFQPEREPHAAILYGPALPLRAGPTRLSLHLSSNAPAGTLLGRFRLRYVGKLQQSVDVVAGQTAVLEWEQPANAWFNVEFVYAGTANLNVQGIELRTP